MTTLAYIDPVSGSIILQLLVAGVLGAIAYFRKGLWKILSIFGGGSKEDPVD